jgi:hypothetical protein
MPKPRDYKREYEIYHGKKKEIQRRALRNKARRLLAKMGKVKKGDKKDVHHKNHDVSNSSLGNLEVMSRNKNRSIK